MLDFDGTDDVVNCGSDATLDDLFSGGGTLTGWIYPQGWGEDDAGRIMEKSGFTSPFLPQGWFFIVSNIFGAEALQFAQDFVTSSGWWSTDNSTIVLNTLYHVAVTYDSDSDANEPMLYIDGVSVTVNEPNTPSGAAVSDASQNFLLGNSKVIDRAYNGYLGDLRAYGRILSPEEISTIYVSRGHDGIVQSLLGRWAMNEGPPGVTFPQVTRIGSWTGETQYESNGFTYTPGAGPDRLALIMISTYSDTDPVASVSSVTLGGQTMTAIETAAGVVIGAAGADHNLLWLGYLNESEIGSMSGSTLTINWGQAPNTPTGETMAQGATYGQIVQGSPIADSASNTGNFIQTIQAGAVTVGLSDRNIYVTLDGEIDNHVAPTGYTEQLELDGVAGSHSNASCERNITIAGSLNPTAEWSLGFHRLAIISAVLNGTSSVLPDLSENGNDGEVNSEPIYRADSFSFKKRMI